MSLDMLFAKAGICKYKQALWFSSSRLVQSTLLVADIDQYGAIQRMWLGRLRGVMPDLQVTFSPSSKPVESRPAPAKKSIWKKAYTGRIDHDADQGDLL